MYKVTGTQVNNTAVDSDTYDWPVSWELKSRFLILRPVEYLQRPQSGCVGNDELNDIARAWAHDGKVGHRQGIW